MNFATTPDFKCGTALVKYIYLTVARIITLSRMVVEIWPLKIIKIRELVVPFRKSSHGVDTVGSQYVLHNLHIEIGARRDLGISRYVM